MLKIFIFLFLTVFVASCSTEQTKVSEADHEHSAAEDRYTCPMHPQVVEEAPGTCPICGMDLVRVTASTAERDDIMLSDSQMRLGNITTERVSRKEVGQTLTLNGSLTINERQTEVVSSRSAGRIEKLYIEETGRSIRKGQALYTLYSELLLTLQQEYLLAKEQYEALGKTENRYLSFLQAAERKLLLYGLTKNQVAQLQDRNSLQPRITFLAPASGVVTEINITEGQYVAEGAMLYKVEDIGTLWVEAELYPGEAHWVGTGDRVTITVNGSENNPIEATVNFLSPEYRAGTQVTTLRASIQNPKLKLKPGQQVQVHLTHSSREAIAVPVDAVIRDPRGTHVYIQSGENTFRPTMVKTGIETFDRVEITEGVEEGDTIAVSGAYLLYSEVILKKGLDPLAEHNH
jgi:Cu(I)/Ag(I) efflux system membrane fusion protein